jgi:hypothetical protein
VEADGLRVLTTLIIGLKRNAEILPLAPDAKANNTSKRHSRSL